MPNLDWEDEDLPDGADPRSAPVLVYRMSWLALVWRAIRRAFTRH